MKRFKRKTAILVLVLAALLLGACGSDGRAAGATPGTDGERVVDAGPGTGGERAVDAGPGTDGARAAGATPGIGERTDASKEGEAVEEEAGESEALFRFGSYFKTGDYRYQLEIEPGGPDEPDMLQLSFFREASDSGYFMPPHEFHISSHDVSGTWTGEDLNSESSGSEFRIVWGEDGSVALLGETEAAGTYYPEEGNLIMPEAFDRPLNDTDLMDLSQEQLKLIRNQFYAVYGREFKSKDLKGYFEAMPWYEGGIRAEDFDEGIMKELERRNISFLKAAEEHYEEDRDRAAKTAYEALAPAPYRSLLPERGEIYVEMYSDAGHAEDKGIYYEAEGSISVPITVSMEQYEALEQGREIELVSDDITGGTQVLKKAGDAQYGDYVLMDPKNSDEMAGRFVFLSYEPYSRTFRMWADSEDTVFKRVYEGNIYVLKGACEEYANYFNLPGGERPQGAGAFRVMDFNESGPYGPTPYQGNILVTDSKGYVKALYFKGD